MRFDISVHDSFFVKMRNRCDYISDEFESLIKT